MLSFWEKNSFLNYDCVIVGSGILGLSTACAIKEKEPESSILIIERGILPTGASTKNAGFLCFGSATEILADIKSLGENEAVSLVEKRWKGINLLIQRLGKEKMDFLNYGGYEMIDESYLSAVEKIPYLNQLLQHVFKKDVFEAKPELVKDFGFNSDIVKTLLYSPFESQIDTGLMMKSLIGYAQSLGIAIINGCNVKEFESANGRIKIFAEHNILKERVTFITHNMVVCANAFTSELMQEINIKPGRGHVIITNPIPDLKFKGLFHYDEGFYYFRNYGERVIFGGGRNLDFETEATLEFEFNDKILADLIDKLHNIILPGVQIEIEDKWTGIMGFSADRLPAITKISDNIFTINSCNGMGIALSSYMAEEFVKYI